MLAKAVLTPSAPITKIKGVGPVYQQLLERLEIKSVRDLLHHYPRRFLDYTHPVTINHLVAKKNQVFSATLAKPRQFRTKNGKLITQVKAADATGEIDLFWFNSPFISRLIRPNTTYTVAGVPSLFGDKICLIAAQLESATAPTKEIKGLLPIYPLTMNITHHWLRKILRTLLDQSQISDPLPPTIKQDQGLLDYHEALAQIHFPSTINVHDEADKRLSFNRHLATNITNLLSIKDLPPSPALNIDHALHQRLLSLLPFTLTSDQTRTITASYRDIQQVQITHRLIQGETGSGKTVILFFLAAQTLANGYSFCLLAPTEILAQQHRETFLKFGLKPSDLVLVTANSKLKESPTHPVVFIGTHALMHQLPVSLKFPLALVAIDEQHKFGVGQKASLEKRLPPPHIFNLSATPIPRSIALGLMGEINISTIKNKPRQRLPVKTWIVTPTHFTQKSTPWLSEKLRHGSKIFVVCPQIETGENGQVSAVKKIWADYQREFKSLVPVLMIHGRLPSQEINTVLAQFKKAPAAILVTTTVIEVGLDIPEAEIIIIHSAERFGLATLHQLRGRVGRGDRPSYCFLIGSDAEQGETKRLRLLTKYTSGLTLAKLDLRLRGAGELFGHRQHGWLPMRLKHFWDKKLFRQTKVVAAQIIENNPKTAAAIADKLISW